MKSAFIRSCLSAAAILLTMGSDAQTSAPAGSIGFKWGEEYELPRKHEDLGFVGNSTDGYIQLGHRRRESLSFQRFDASLHYLGETETDLSVLPRDYTNELFGMIGDKYYWFFSTYERGDDKESLYAQEIELGTGKLKGNAREIASTSKLTGDVVARGYFQVGLANKWNFYYSFDRTKMVIQYRKKPERRNDAFNNDVIGFIVLDQDLQQQWKREIRMPYTEKKMDNEDYQVDNRGNVYLLAKVYNEERGDRKHPDYRFEILRWGADKPEVTKIPFRFTDKFVNTATVTEDPNGNIIVSGYYSSRKYSGSTDGVFILKLDESTGELKNVMKGMYEFPVSLMAEFESGRTRRRMERRDDKDKAEAERLVMRSVTIGRDGSIRIVGEEHFIIVTTYSNGRTTTTTTTYYYNDILAMKIGSNGEIEWARKIPKSQAGGAGRGDMSFKEYSFGKDTYFFFLDNKKNIDLPLDEAPAGHRDGAGGVLMAVKIDENGKMSKQQVFDVREEHVRISPAEFDYVGNNQLIVRGRARRRESQAALITFN